MFFVFDTIVVHDRGNAHPESVINMYFRLC